MILVLASNLLLIEDPWIDAFVAETDTIEIEYKLNCGDVVTIVPELEDINVDNQYPLVLVDGVYSITLVNTTDENTILRQTRCIVNISDATRCKLIEKVEEKCIDNLIELYTALQLVNGCEECDCIKACKIYDSFVKELADECNC